MARRSWRVLLVILCVCFGGAWQAQAPQPAFRSGTQVVSIFATVVDADKRLVPSLTQDDFEILDNDKPQSITLFNNEIQPITVIVMLDTSLSMTGSIAL